MTSTTTKPDSSQPASEMAVDVFDNWFDPVETEVRAREFIEELIRSELDDALARPLIKEARGPPDAVAIAVPRARLDTAEGGTAEWKSQARRPARITNHMERVLREQGKAKYADQFKGFDWKTR